MPTTTAAVAVLERIEYVDDGKTITAPGDHPWGDYAEGELVLPFDMAAAHLREMSTTRTPSGKISAEARRASAEVARRKANRGVKNLAHQLLADAGLL